MTKEGLKKPNYWGSLTQASTVRIGNYLGEEAFVPMNSLLPMVHPNDLVLGGWDISAMNLAEAMERAQVCLHTLCQSQSQASLPCCPTARSDVLHAEKALLVVGLCWHKQGCM